MKKFMMIALISIGFMALLVPDSKAGVSIGIGFGFPGVYGYPAYYPYGYGCYPYGVSYYPYGAPYYQPVIYYSAVFGPYYWWHGHRVYLRHRHF